MRSTDGKTPVDDKLLASSVVLVLVNLVPLYGVLELGWTVGSVLLLFWLENLVIGLFTVLRILTAASLHNPLPAKLFTVIFFSLHYGLFCLVHGTLLVELFDVPAMGGQPVLLQGLFLPLEIALGLVLSTGLLWPLLAIAASHGFSYLANYLGDGEFRTVGVRQLMSQPYPRIMVLQLTLILGGMLLQWLDSPLPGLVLLLAIKIVLDLAAHRREHRLLRTRQAGSAQARSASTGGT